MILSWLNMFLADWICLKIDGWEVQHIRQTLKNWILSELPY